jgi:hypothetical protein
MKRDEILENIYNRIIVFWNIKPNDSGILIPLLCGHLESFSFSMGINTRLSNRLSEGQGG